MNVFIEAAVGSFIGTAACLGLAYYIFKPRIKNEMRNAVENEIDGLYLNWASSRKKG